MSNPEHPETHISFEGAKLKGTSPRVTISGIAAESIRRPEKIRQLMDLLGLPEGTNARIVFTGSDVIVR